MSDRGIEARGKPGWVEADRLAALKRYKILDTPPEPAFDDIVKIAARICDVPDGADQPGRR